MKLAVTLALLTLAFGCSPASANVCTGFLQVMQTLFMGTPSEYETTIELFSPEAEMKDAAMEVKTLVDALLQQAKDSIMRRMDKILKSPLCV